jgi:hypothetical protein
MSTIQSSWALVGFRSALSDGTARCRTVRSIAYTTHAIASTPSPTHSRRPARVAPSAVIDIQTVRGVKTHRDLQQPRRRYTALVRARPQRIVIERGGLRAEVDPANMPQEVAGALSRLLDEMRPTEEPDAVAEEAAYDVVLDYGDHRERLRYGEAELPGDVRETLDARLESGE